MDSNAITEQESGSLVLRVEYGSSVNGAALCIDNA